MIAIHRVAVFMHRRQWLLLALIAPALLLPTPGRSLALLGLPALWLATWRVTGAPFPRTPLNGPLLVLSLMLMVSLYATPDLPFSLGKITGLLLGISLFFAGLQFGQTSPWHLAALVLAFLVLGGGVGLLALLATDWPERVGLLNRLLALLPQAALPLPGLKEGFLQHNEVAGTLLWAAPVALALAAAGRGPQGAPGRLGQMIFFVAAGAACLTVAVIVFTQSRGGLLGLGAAGLALLMLSGRRAQRLGLGVGLALIVGAVASLIWLGPARVGEFVFGSAGNLAAATSAENLVARVEVWSRAIYAIQDFPLTGLGLNMFRRVVHVLYPPFLVSPTFDLAHAHNTWLQVALDLGLPGLIGYLALWINSGLMLLDVWRTAPHAWLRSLSIGILASWAGSFVYGLTDTVALGAKPGVLWWMLLALVSAAWSAGQSGER